MPEERTESCSRCGRAIFAATALATGGICRPCRNTPSPEVQRAQELANLAARAPLTAEQFAQWAADANEERACHLVFDKAEWRMLDFGPQALTEGERTLLLVETLLGEVCNGGFEQFLDGSTAIFAPELPEALVRCGLPQFAPLAIRLKRLLPNTPSQEGLEEIGAELEELTSEFYEILDQCGVERYRNRLHAYVFTNRRQFVRCD